MVKDSEAHVVIIWFPVTGTCGLMLKESETTASMFECRNATVIKLLSGGRIGYVQDWFWRDEDNKPMEAIWHEYRKAPKKWTRKYLLIWWKKLRIEDEAGQPNAMVVYKKRDAHALASMYRAILLEVMHRGWKLGETYDYKFCDKNGEPAAIEWKNLPIYGPPAPWRGPLVSLERFPRM